MIENCNPIDVKPQVQRFTWICKMEEGIIKERIDRALVNLNWMEEFLRTQVFNLPIIGCDHGPVLMDADFKDLRAQKQFKFEIFWVEKKMCRQIIKEG